MPQRTFLQLLTEQMRKNKPIDFLYPGSKRSIIKNGKLTWLFPLKDTANVEFLNSGKPETIEVPIHNIYIPGPSRSQ